MEQINNIVIFIFFYVFIHLIFFRFLNFNINKIFTVFLVFFASLFMLFNDYSYTILLNLVIFNIFVLSFYILIPGVLNNGPAFTIIDLLINGPVNGASWNVTRPRGTNEGFLGFQGTTWETHW